MTRPIQIIFSVFVVLMSANFTLASLVDHSFKPFITRTNETYINVFAVQPDGKYLVGGRFESADGYVRNSIARFNADGTLDTGFNSPTNGFVEDIIILPDGKILIGGSSVSLFINGRLYEGIARLNPDGSADTGFFNGKGVGGVKSMALQPDGKIVVAGNLAEVDGHMSTRGAARFNSDGSVDTSFTTQVQVGYPNSVLVLPDGDILLGGDFLNVNNQSRSRIARLNSDGGLDPAVVDVSGTIYSLGLQPDGKILVGGRIEVVNNVSRKDIFRLNADLTLDTGFVFNNNNFFGSTYSIEQQPDGKVLIGGLYNNSQTNTIRSLVRLNQDGSVDDSFNTLTGGRLVYASAVLPSGEILAGGTRDYEISYRNMFYKLSQTGNIDSNFRSSVGRLGWVGALEVTPNGKIYIAGDFMEVNGKDRSRVARLNRDGSLDDSFNPTGINGIIYATALQADGKLIIAGDFGLVNGLSRLRLTRLNPDGSVDTTFNIGSGAAGGVINEVVVQADEKIIIGGLFNTYNNITRHKIARINSDGSLDSSFDLGSPGPGNAVNKIVPLADGKYLIGGSFYTINGQSIGQITRLNANGTRDLTFNPGGAGATGPQDTPRMVEGIVIQADGRIVIGGSFFGYNGVARTNMARLFSDGMLDASFTPTTEHVFTMVQQSDRKILIGGNFSTLNGTPQSNLARLNPDGTRDGSFDIGSGADGYVYDLAFLSNDSVIVAGIFLKLDGQDHLGLARLGPAPASLLSAPFDFDGDNKTDVSIFRPSNGQWWINRSSSGQTIAGQFGQSTDLTVPADFTGDNKADVAIFRPASGEWFILRSEDSSYFSFPFGIAGDIPFTGDFDADGKTDLGVFRPSTATWYINKSSGGTLITTFGAAGDVPVIGDYDGDGKSDIAIYRPSNGQWWLNRSTQGVIATTFGISTDKPVVGDYTGDGKTDIAFFRPSSGEWFIVRSEDASYYSVPFGLSGDIPAPGDYDSDGKFDTAVFRPSGATWYVNRSTAGLMIMNFGASGDRPVPSSFIP